MDTPFIPEAFHAATADIPFTDDWPAPGVRMQLLMADVEGGVFTVRIKFAPGVCLAPHKHTGAVHAFTLAGEWSYLEYPDSPPNRAGSYLYEPPGSTHQLKVADSNVGETDVYFVIYGAMLHLDEAGQVVAVGDAESHLREWQEALRAQGKAVPPIITGGRMHYSRP